MKQDLLIGLHKDQHGRVDPYLQIYEQILDHNGIKHLRLEASQPDFWEIVAKLDLILFHWVYIDRDHQMAETLIPIIEKEMGKRCFPDWNTFWHYNDKIKQYYLLKQHNFPVVKSHIFWDERKAYRWIDSAKFPLVFKLSRGAFSQDVILIKDKKTAKVLISQMFDKGLIPGSLPASGYPKLSDGYRKFRNFAWIYKQKLLGKYIHLKWEREKGYVFFQNFLPANPFTTRVTVIGDRAFVFNIKTGENDFRAYDMQQISFDLNAIDLECVKIAFNISNKLRFQCMAYDFLFDQYKNPLVCEMGYTSYALDIYSCPGYFDTALNWHTGHFWPQYLQLVDLLDLPDQRQPQIDFEKLN